MAETEKKIDPKEKAKPGKAKLAPAVTRFKEKLNFREKAFAQAYFTENFNATKAAEKAGYSKKTAGAKGYELLKKVGIQEELLRISKRIDEKNEKKADDVVQRAVNMGFANLTDYMSYDETGVRIKPSDELTEAQKAAIEEVELTTDADGKQKFKFKLAKRDKYIELLFRFHKLLDEIKLPSDGDRILVMDLRNANIQVNNNITQAEQGPIRAFGPVIEKK